MNLLCASISHHTAPIALREKICFSEVEIRNALSELNALGFPESVLASSVDRTELCCAATTSGPQGGDLIDFLLTRKKLDGTVTAKNFASFAGTSSVEHLFKMTSGLDSMIVGETSIAHAIQTGYRIAREAGSAGLAMTRLFETAFRVAGRVGTETRLSEGAISVSEAVIELARHIFNVLGQKRALIIGSGDTVLSAAQQLKAQGIGALTVTNRSAERAELLAGALGGSVIMFETFREQLPEIDIVLSSLQSAPHILTAKDIRFIVKKRTSGMLFLIDLGDPHNIDPFVSELENVILYDLHSLNVLVGNNIKRRRAEVSAAQAIVAEELANFRVPN